MFYQTCLHGVVEKVGECSYVDEKFQKKESYVNEKFQRKYVLCGIYTWR